MRPFHEVMRLVGLDEAADISEPGRGNPLALADLGTTLHNLGKSFAEVDAGMELLTREENIKPSILLAASREVRVRAMGQPHAIGDYRRLIFSGRMERGDLIFRAHPSLETAKQRHPSRYQP